MRIVIAGQHGQITRRLARSLSGRGDTAVVLIRDAVQEPDLRTDGAEQNRHLVAVDLVRVTTPCVLPGEALGEHQIKMGADC